MEMSAIPEDCGNIDRAPVLDVGAWLSTVVGNWWVILGFVALGVAVAAVPAWVSAKEYTATSAVYIGQATDANGSPIAGLTSGAYAVTQLLHSDDVLGEAAERTGSGMTAAKLGEGLTVETSSSTTKTSASVMNIVAVGVTDTDKKRAAAAANALAAVLLERMSGGSDEKIAVLERQLADGKAALAASVERSRMAQAALRAIARRNGGQADGSAAASYMAVVQAAASEQQAREGTNQKTELMLLTARQVEQPQLLHKAVPPSSASGPVLAVNVAAGALAGVVVGIIGAFVRRRFAEQS